MGKMIFFIFIGALVNAEAKSLEAVHFSQVRSRIDETSPASLFHWNCNDCIATTEDENVLIHNNFAYRTDGHLSTHIDLTEKQNLRISIIMIDYAAKMLNRPDIATVKTGITLLYSDGFESAPVNISCIENCYSGEYSGDIDINNNRDGQVQIKINWHAAQDDTLQISKISKGDFILYSEINEESKGIVDDSCDGKITGNMFFGKAGVGKSTVASWIATQPGLFEVGTSESGTTTLGTWISSSIQLDDFCDFANDNFQPIGNLSLPTISDLSGCGNDHFTFLDTEGLDHQTEYGKNYDVVTILPHATVSENVVLIVRDRLNANEIREVIDKLAKAAEKTSGTLTFRDGKIFGHFTIVVNKCQDISSSDEEALDRLASSNPSLISDINRYFTHGPEVVLLPNLEWNYEDRPNFNDEGFYLDYEHILTAHPPLRDRMLYGLKRLAKILSEGVSMEDSYFMTCSNFESLLEQMYEETTEDIIHIDDLEYESLLVEASVNLTVFVSSFHCDQIGLTQDFKVSVCPQSTNNHMGCIEEGAIGEVEKFYQDAIKYIQRIFPKGEESLRNTLDEIFPTLVQQPVDNWFAECQTILSSEFENMYTAEFLAEFDSSIYFDSCFEHVEGKLSWYEWTQCSVSCGGGLRHKVAQECIPSYSVCKGLQVKQETCNNESCIYSPQSDSPAGTIVSWIAKPNSETDKYAEIPDKWILCDGIQMCKSGLFENETCTDLTGRALIGTASAENLMQLKAARFPDHEHNHKHTGQQSFTVPDEEPKYAHRQGNNKSNHCWSSSLFPVNRYVNVDFSYMENHPAPVSSIKSPGVVLTTNANDLYPPHALVHFIFKCV